MSVESKSATSPRISARQVFDIALVLVLAGVVYTAMGYNSQARLMPLLVGVPVLVLAVLQTINDFRSQPKPKAGASQVADAVDIAQREGTARVTGLAGTLAVYGWVLLVFVMIYLIGFVATTFLYTLLFMKVRSRMGWGISLGVSAGFLAFMYLLMIMALQVQLYDGILVLTFRKSVLGY